MKTLLTIVNLFIYSIVFCQSSFFEDFESYPDSGYIAASNPKWITWKNEPGTDNDVRVTREQSKSGLQSAKIYSTWALGGPMDLVLPFGEQINDKGLLTLKMSLYVPSGKNAYFNIQEDIQPAVGWDFHLYFENNKMLLSRNGTNMLDSVAFSHDKWVDIRLEYLRKDKLLKIYQSDSLVFGRYLSINGFAALDLYPTDILSLFYVDDISYIYDTIAYEVRKDIEIRNVNWEKSKLAGTAGSMQLVLENKGSDVINSFDLEIEFKDNKIFKNYSGLNLKWNKLLYLDLPLINIEKGLNIVKLSIVKINGKDGDDNNYNNNFIMQINGITPAENKFVIVEHRTATIDPIAPWGLVQMDRLKHNYFNSIIPICVHSYKPMEVEEYDSFVHSYFEETNLSYFTNRIKNNDYSSPDELYVAEVVKRAQVKFEMKAIYDSLTQNLDVFTEVEFLDSINNGLWYITTILTEDGVTGSSENYAQANYFSGSDFYLPEYNNLPDPVPASMMVYNHVARAANGLNVSPDNKIGLTFKKGNKVIHKTSFKINEDWNLDSINIIPILFKGGNYVNAFTSNAKEVIRQSIISSTIDKKIDSEFEINLYPNPAQSEANLLIDSDDTEIVDIKIYSMAGNLLNYQKHDVNNGTNKISLNLSNLNSGSYVVNVILKNKVYVEKLVIK